MSSNWTKLKRKLFRKKSADRPLDTSASVPVKPHYFRRFFYAFAAFFILFGLIGLVWFVYHEDPNAFGRAEKYYREGLEYQEDHDLKKALKCYEKCLKISSSYPDARLQMVLIYEAQGNYDKAEELLNEGLTLQPRYEEYYRQMVYLLTHQNRIAEALDYLNNITATYIVVKLNAERPAAISSYPAPGTFVSATEVTLNIPENATVYYTTDGTTPDKNSATYNAGEKIPVEKGTVNVRAVAISEAGMIGPEFDASFRVYNDKTEYQFKDPKVEALVRVVLGKTNGTVFYKDLEAVTSLNTVTGAASGVKGSITTLEDLPEMVNLTSVILDGETQIASFEPLKRLAQLKTLSVNKCGLTDDQLTQISSVIWLHTVSAENNALTTLSPVASMLSLRSLDVSGNKIKAVPSLSKLTMLSSLDLSGNALSSLSWATGNTSLETLNVGNNLITDLSPLATCPALCELNAESNLITSLTPLASCTRMETLNINGNHVTTLADLQNLAGMINLSAARTEITSVEFLSRLTRLTTLDVSGTGVHDFTPLAGSQIKNLSASACGISDLSTMVMLTSLEVLDVSGNYLSEITSVALMYQLNVVNFSGNYVTDFSPLLNCSRLTSVNCTGLKVPDSVLSQLKKKHVSVIQ